MKRSGSFRMLFLLFFVIVILGACSATPVPAPSTSLPTAAAAAPMPTSPLPMATLVPPSATATIPTDTPTATPTPTVAPTDTPLPSPTASPTSTPIPVTATATRKPATATPATLTLSSALAKSKSSNSYRFTIAETYSDPRRSSDLLNATGEHSGGTTHMIMSGFMALVLGSGTTAEVIMQGGNFYAKGPLILLNANEAKWYILPSGKTSVNPGAQLDIGPTAFDKIGSEGLDAMTCDIYTVDKPTALQALQASGTLTAEQLANTVNVELTYWVCPDRYVHQSLTRVDVRDRSDPSTTDIVKSVTHYFDYNVPIEVPQPTGAVPLPQ
jgi:hypothetical protein